MIIIGLVLLVAAVVFGARPGLEEPFLHPRPVQLRAKPRVYQRPSSSSSGPSSAPPSSSGSSCCSAGLVVRAPRRSVTTRNANKPRAPKAIGTRCGLTTNGFATSSTMSTAPTARAPSRSRPKTTMPPAAGPGPPEPTGSTRSENHRHRPARGPAGNYLHPRYPLAPSARAVLLAPIQGWGRLCPRN